jgi:hypothetical protein
VDDVFTISSEDEKSISAKTISLLLTPDQTEKVSLATELGKIKLVMRSPEDKELAAVEGAMPSDLFDEGGRSDRDKDSNLLEPSKPDKDEQSQSFMEFLKSQQAAQAGSAAGCSADHSLCPGARDMDHADHPRSGRGGDRAGA